MSPSRCLFLKIRPIPFSSPQDLRATSVLLFFFWQISLQLPPQPADLPSIPVGTIPASLPPAVDLSSRPFFFQPVTPAGRSSHSNSSSSSRRFSCHLPNGPHCPSRRVYLLAQVGIIPVNCSPVDNPSSRPSSSWQLQLAEPPTRQFFFLLVVLLLIADVEEPLLLVPLMSANLLSNCRLLS